MKLNHTPIYVTCSLLGLLLAACGTAPIAPSDKHIAQPSTASAQGAADIPLANKRTIPLPPPKPTAKVETYSVVVSNVPAQEILFALARDAKINLDISSGIQGNVSINAINQTLPQILDRISKQVDMRYEVENGTLSVMPDKPFLKTYKIDFINIKRTANSTNTTSSQISGGSTGGAGSGNAASTTVTSETKNDLMESLINNVTAILLEEDRLRQKSQKEALSSSKVVSQGDGIAATYTGPPGGKGKQTEGGGEAVPGGGASGSGDATVQAAGTARVITGEFEKSVSVFANKETGVLIVRATSKQHEKVQEFIDKVMSTAKRQVLIEATIIEVRLNDQYQQGIDWTGFALGAGGLTVKQGLNGVGTLSGALTIVGTTKIITSISLLEKFGNVKVLSSPKLSVMNNQTASLKVADSKVYFTVASTPALFDATGKQTSAATFNTTPVTVSVGLTMSVTPQISDSDTVTINVRPSVSRILSFAKDPNPSLANPCAGNTIIANSDSCRPIENLVPEIQTREMESIIKIESGQTAVMGGLIQDEINKTSSEVPLLARIPFLGQLFQNRNDTTTKTELVIFLRPVVIKDASLGGDFKEFSKNLPDAHFFHEDARGTRTER